MEIVVWIDFFNDICLGFFWLCGFGWKAHILLCPYFESAFKYPEPGSIPTRASPFSCNSITFNAASGVDLFAPEILKQAMRKEGLSKTKSDQK